jgi:hypothetical protein
MIMRKIVLVLGFILLTFYSAFIFMLKAEQWRTNEILNHTSYYTHYTFRSYTSLVLLTLLAYICAWFSIIMLRKKLYGKGSLLITALTACIFLQGHVVARRHDYISEQFLWIRLHEKDITDPVIRDFNMSGYDPNYHSNPDYPHYEYYNTFFFRYYQVGKGEEMFKTFRGFGPLFSLEEKRLNK